MTRAYIYTRKSTRTKQEHSHSTQHAECDAYANAQLWNVERVYSDTCSGTVPAFEREAFCELLSTLCKGDVVLTFRRDRVGRDVVNNAVTERLIAKAGARLVSLDAHDGDSPESVMMKSMLDTIAQYERAVISLRTKATLAAKRERGERTGTVPLGYKDEGGRVIKDNDEQAKIERVRELRVSGLSFSRIQEFCEREGIVSRNGATPSGTTLRRWCNGIEVTRPKRKPRSPNVNPRKPHRARPSLNELHPQLVYVIQDLREKGLSLRAIAAELARREYRTSKGRAYALNQVARILNTAKSAKRVRSVLESQ